MKNIPILIYALLKQNDHDRVQQNCESFFKRNSNIILKIFTDIFKCAKEMAEFEADSIFIDDSLFDQFISEAEMLKTKKIHFTFKRFVIFSTQKKFSEERKIELSLLAVRRVFIGIKNFLPVIKSIVSEIVYFQRTRPKTSLCVSGGGFDGYMYSLGVCFGLEKCLQNFEMKDFDNFCGISSGSILSACFAGGVNTAELVQQAHKKHEHILPMTICTLFDFAIFDFIKNTYRRRIPIGIFKGEKLKNFFARQIEYFGVEDNLEVIKKNLYIFATEQDTGETVVFGKNPWKKDIKISQAIRASIALPPFYLPENIHGRWFTDGQLVTNTNFNLPLQEKSSLIVIIDPIVAFSTEQAGGVKNRGGYFTLLQAIKKLIHSRSDISLEYARDTYPDVDFIKFQPTHEIMEKMSGNPMHVPIRDELIEASALATCKQILQQYEFFQHKFSKHGLTLKPQSEIMNLKELQNE